MQNFVKRGSIVFSDKLTGPGFGTRVPEQELVDWQPRSGRWTVEDARAIVKSCGAPKSQRKIRSAGKYAYVCRKLDPNLTDRDGRLIAAGWNHFSPTEWVGRPGKNDGVFSRFYSYWLNAVERPHVVGSSYNIIPESVVIAMIVGLPPSLASSCPTFITVARKLRWLSHGRIRPDKRTGALSFAKVICGYRKREHSRSMPEIRISDWIRLARLVSRSPEYEIRFAVSEALKESVEVWHLRNWWERKQEIDWFVLQRVLKQLAEDRTGFLLRAAPTKELWKETTGRVPSDPLRNHVKDRRVVIGFPTRDYLRAHRYLSLQFDDPDDSEDVVRYAAGLACTFGSRWMEWVKIVVNAATSQDLGEWLHDFVYFLPVNILPEDGLGEALLRWYKQKAYESGIAFKNVTSRDLSTVCHGWFNLPFKYRSATYKTVLNYVRSHVYDNIRNEEFALYAANAGIGDGEYHSLESRWLESVAFLDRESIPSFDISTQGLRVYRVDRMDPRGIWLGRFTACCQFPGATGETCAWHGATQHDGGFIAVESKGTIVAQSWLWRYKDILVLDNVEALHGPYRDALPMVVEAIADTVIGKLGISEVRIGTSRSDCPLLDRWEPAEPVPTPPGCYTDARTQLIVARTDCPRDVPAPLDPTVDPSEYRIPYCYLADLTDVDASAIVAIEAAAYPPVLRVMEGWQTIEDMERYCECPADRIVIFGNRTTWYCLVAIKDDEAEVIDLAKWPGTPRLDIIQLTERIAQVTGAGTIVADARVATSLRRVHELEADFNANGWVIADGAVEYRNEHEFRQLILTRRTES